MPEGEIVAIKGSAVDNDLLPLRTLAGARLRALQGTRAPISAPYSACTSEFIDAMLWGSR